MSAARPDTRDEEIIQADAPAIEALENEEERLERIEGEFRRGFEALTGIGCAVTMVGSARTPESDPMYGLARETARLLGDAGFAVITGGGPGVMEACNRGARDAEAVSIGLNIELPFEQSINPYCDIGIEFHYFFVRKLMFVRYATAFVAFPGGFGTMDELFESLTLSQTNKIKHFPIVLFGTAWWDGMTDWLKERMLDEGKVSPGDLDLFVITDDPAAVVAACYAGAEAQGFACADGMVSAAR